MGLERKAKALIRVNERFNRTADRLLEMGDGRNILQVPLFIASLAHGIRLELAKESWTYASEEQADEFNTFFPLDQAKELLERGAVK